jgi:hypothetical protein
MFFSFLSVCDTQIGTPGHAVVPKLNEALQYWAGKRMRQIRYVHKGMNCLTEMYSAIQADVPIDTDPTTMKNPELMRKLLCCRRVSGRLKGSQPSSQGTHSIRVNHLCILMPYPSPLSRFLSNVILIHRIVAHLWPGEVSLCAVHHDGHPTRMPGGSRGTHGAPRGRYVQHYVPCIVCCCTLLSTMTTHRCQLSHTSFSTPSKSPNLVRSLPSNNLVHHISCNTVCNVM